GDLLHVWMIAEWAAKAGVVVQKLRIEEAEIGQNRVKPDRGVPLAEHEAVPVRPVRPGGGDPEMAVIERREQLRRGEGAGIMSRPGDPGEAHRLLADEPGALGQPLRGDVVFGPAPADRARLVHRSLPAGHALRRAASA